MKAPRLQYTLGFVCGFTLASMIGNVSKIFLVSPSQSLPWSFDLYPRLFDEACLGEVNSFALHGPGFDIFRPFCETDSAAVSHSFRGKELLNPPEIWMEQLSLRFSWVDRLLPTGTRPKETTIPERARDAYLEVLRMHVSALIYGNSEKSVTSSRNLTLKPLDWEAREKGTDWTYLGYTMTGTRRLNNVHALLQDVFQNKVEGDYIETGVWRGGSSIFARGVMRVHNESHRRSFVCDSFKGLPPGDRNLDQADPTWDDWPYLGIASDIVALHFRESGMPDPNVIFVKGFFNDTMEALAPKIQSLAVVRLDGDMYESTVDVLYRLYDKLSIGGYVIVDDWFGFPAKAACEDFFKVHGMNVTIVPIDGLSAYWQKTKQIEIQHWRYNQSKFKDF